MREKKTETMQAGGGAQNRVAVLPQWLPNFRDVK